MNHLRTLIGNFTRLTPTFLNSPQPLQHGHKQLIIDLHCQTKIIFKWEGEEEEEEEKELFMN